MATFKCKMCGGSLDISDDMSVATCEYCGTKQAIPEARDEGVSNRVKKPSGIKLFIEKIKRKKKERVKKCLVFPQSNVFNFYYLLFLILNAYFYFSVFCSPNITYLVVQLPSLLIPTLIKFKRFANKIIAIIVQLFITIIFILFLVGAVDTGFTISDGAFVPTVILTLLNIAMLIFICLTKKVEKEKVVKEKHKMSTISASVTSVLLIVILSTFGIKLCDYQFAKMFYNLKSYEYAEEYFTALGDYKDSEALVNKAKLLELKNANIMDTVYLGCGYDGYGVSTDSSTLWYVVAKEDTKILLLKDSNQECDTQLTIIGGWKNSTLRKFLKEEYYDSIFNEEIKSRIIPTKLKNSSNANDVTTDKIFILSKEDVEKYLPNENLRNQCLKNTMLRNTENGIYNVFCGGKFAQVQFFNDEINIIGYDKITGTSVSARLERYRLRTGVDEIFNNIYTPVRPAMWIDVSEVE